MATADERWQITYVPGAKFIVLPVGRPLDQLEELESFNRNVLEFIKGWRWTTQKTWERIDHYKDTELDPDRLGPTSFIGAI